MRVCLFWVPWIYAPAMCTHRAGSEKNRNCRSLGSILSVSVCQSNLYWSSLVTSFRSPCTYINERVIVKTPGAGERRSKKMSKMQFRKITKCAKSWVLWFRMRCFDIDSIFFLILNHRTQHNFCETQMLFNCAMFNSPECDSI